MADHPRPEASWEQRADELLAKVDAPAPLSEASVARIFAALDRSAPRGFRWRSALAGAGAAFLAVNAAWAAVLGYERYRRPEVPAVPAPRVEPPAPLVAPVPAPEPAPVTLPSIVPAAPKLRVPRAPGRQAHAAAPPAAPVPSVAPPAVAPPQPPSTLVAESAALARAVKTLRQERDARAALGLLDAYDRSFPRGVLRPDAQLLRVETLVALGRRAEAVALLDRLDADDRSGGTAPSAAALARLRREIESSGGVKGGDPSEDE
ncbi:MAG TPA: hypothetical protein VMB50_21465 [Myxococcales bacterium]|nr:hypothetical protein [Myxococcales bacterium]